ncbi:F-box/WD-40 repeat-containing protein-like [Forsythia ovata]|uniref:F-box/WD-40 repeat-containing protein-like n=1 Tax=Forsythia ovata TaxID=205694 RepID=A0ABD1VL33_9LAMI
MELSISIATIKTPENETFNNIKNLNFESENSKSTSNLNVKTKFSVNESIPNYSRSITDLHPALIFEILNCFDPKELGFVSCVNTYLYRLASEHQVWKSFTVRGGAM